MTTDTLQAGGKVGRSAPVPRAVHRYAMFLAVATFLLVVAGGAVTSTDSGLADEHWPSFGGKWIPSWQEMLRDRGLFYEHGHRLIAGVVGLLTVGLAITLWRLERRRWVRWVAAGSVFLVLDLALLGGLTVKLELPPWVSITHVSLAMLFLSLNCTLAVVTGPGWIDETSSMETGEARRLSRFALAVVIIAYVQIVLGAIPRHASPEVGGELMVIVGDSLHIVWAFVLFAVGILLFSRVLGRHGKFGRLLRPSMLLALLLVLQVFLGFATFITQPKDPALEDTYFHEAVASVHQATGALLLVTLVVLALRARRILHVSLNVSTPAAAPGGES